MILPEYVSQEMFHEALSLAGRVIGLAQYRPTYGRFQVVKWYLNDRTDEGWVFPQGDYYYYDRLTSQHQKKIGTVLKLVGEHPNVKVAYPDPWAEVAAKV